MIDPKRGGVAILLAGLAAVAAAPAFADIEAKTAREARSYESLEDLFTPAEFEAEFLTSPADLGIVPEEPAPRATVLGIDPADLDYDAAARMTDLVPDHLWEHFDLFLYINKAADGPLAQQLLVYEKTGEEIAEPTTSALRLRHRWLASTGRERYERYFTTTPVGLFKLDPDRFFVRRRSYQWNGTRMPYAMFFDYEYSTRKSGYAIHAAVGEGVDYLGQRASGGCIRLHIDQAKTLFETIQDDHVGEVPEFLFVPGEGTVRDGRLERLADGSPIMDRGYRVLLVIDLLTGPMSQK